MDTRFPLFYTGKPLNTAKLFEKEEKLRKSQTWKRSNQKHPAYKK